MSDREVPQNDKPENIDDVVGSANEGLDAAAAARAEVPGPEADVATATPDAAPAGDPDLDAFAAAERDYPGTFGTGASDIEAPAADTYVNGTRSDADAHDADAHAADRHVSDTRSDADRAVADSHVSADDDATSVLPATSLDDANASTTSHAAATHSVADDAYAPPAAAATQVMPAEPVVAAAPQPIFVQAPEPPRELGNRGAAGAIGFVATLVFGILYLGAILGLGALAGDVTVENLGTAALAPLMTWAFWVPVVVFFLSFWLLGAFLNRARWGKWVIFGLLVAAATYGGHLLGQLFQAPFWQMTASESAALVDEQLLAPLAIAAFVFARELTIWFGAWVARSGAKKKVLNAEAQAEYERTLEAGPSALR